MADIQPWDDLREHIGTLIALISIMVITIVGLLKGWWSDTSEKFKVLRQETAEQMKDVWEEVNRLKQNQVTLRADWPKTFLLREDWKEMNHERLATLERIEKKLDGFIESCRKGECARGGNYE